MLITMDDWDDDFLPLSMSGISSKTEKNEISCSQASTTSRLSKSFRKRKINNLGSCAGSTTTSLLNSEDSEQPPSNNGIKFCPTCQVPFDIMKINPFIHSSQCEVSWNDLEECPDGEQCHSDRIMHYRDYAHSILAQIRSSRSYISTAITTPSRATTSRRSDTFKVPQSKSTSKKSGISYSLVNDQNTNIRRQLFNDIDSCLSSSSSSKDTVTNVTPQRKVNTKIISKNYKLLNNENCASNKKSMETESNSIIINPQTMDNLNEDFIHHEADIDVRIKDKEKLLGNEGSAKLTNLHSFADSHENNEMDCDFKTMTNKRKAEKHTYKLSNKIGKTSNLTSREILKAQKNTNESVDVLNSVTPKQKHVTILDTIDFNHVENESNLDADDDRTTCDCSVGKRRKFGHVEECKSCKENEENANRLPRGENTCTREDSKEVRATMSVIVSPTNEDKEDYMDETRVKVDASCNKLGWKTVGIAVPSTTEVDNVNVTMCKCTKTMEINCSLSKHETQNSLTKDENQNDNELQVKFFSQVNDNKFMNRKNEKSPKSEVANHQMSITSFFKASKQPSTLTLKTSIETTDEELRPSCSSWVANNVASDEAVTSKENKESVVASWKNIMKRMVQKGQSKLSIMSDDSLATTDSQTSAEIPQKYYRSSKKTCPFYKIIPDTPFVVDAFQYGYIPGITHYFLSHFHSDHYGGLKKSFSKPLYCSQITAALVKLKLRVDERHIHVLEQDTPRKISGVLVTALDANHCPGSVMFLFQLQDGRNFLHVGDFRADPKMESYPCFWNLSIDVLFLDTTYCEPKYDFPLQTETITRVTEIAKEHVAKSSSTLFVCGTYTIGKEKVFIAIAEALNCKIWAHPDKRKVLDCINNPEINQRLTTKQLEAQVHVGRMTDLNYQFLQRYLIQHRGKFTHLVAFIPTGWEMKSKKNDSSDNINMTSYGNVTMYGVPYSEHSSFKELKRFVQFLKPVEVIPTVNVERLGKRLAMKRHFKNWLSEPPLASQTVTNENKHSQQKIKQYLYNCKSNNA